ncbi:hypothetical protein MVEN_00633300 [Mycena venus]|uniref:Uncharacterized protein n=1 Tax=Mycena venus TaxID=2733690 RepID=A0A8H6YKJ8_9AGAR|nr:hypothetical protein MVEN_00633300 [Mycena venus]
MATRAAVPQSVALGDQRTPGRVKTIHRAVLPMRVPRTPHSIVELVLFASASFDHEPSDNNVPAERGRCCSTRTYSPSLPSSLLSLPYLLTSPSAFAIAAIQSPLPPLRPVPQLRPSPHPRTALRLDTGTLSSSPFPRLHPGIHILFLLEPEDLGTRTRQHSHSQQSSGEFAGYPRVARRLRFVEKENGRPPPSFSSAPVAGGLPSFTFPANYGYSSMDPTGFFAHPAPSLPSLPSAPGSWDAGASSSWFPASIQQPSIPATPQWNDRSIQSDWDDLVSSFQPAAAQTHSTGLSAGNFSNDSYGTDLLMANISDEYSSSVFSSAPPSSIPEDDDWSSRGWSSSGSRPVSAAPSSTYSDARGDRPVIFTHLLGVSCSFSLPSPPFVSVEIEQWDGTNWATADLPCMEANVRLADEAPDMDARLGWDFKPSKVEWLDPDVSSEVAEFPQGIRLTERNKIYAFHRVTGCPSQFPFSRQRTGFLINLTDVKGMNPDREVTVDQLIRDQVIFSSFPRTQSTDLRLSQDSHSWGRSTGARNKPDAYVPGSFFGLSGDIKIACRRAAPECGGVTACESLDPAFLKGERRELDPEDSRSLAAATLRTREMQDDTEVGRTLAFHHSLQRWRCRGIRTDGTQCDGSICLRKLNTCTPFRNKSHILLCSKRGEALTFGALHSQVHILDHISEELFIKVMNGERIIDEDDTEGTCSRVVSGRTGSKGKGICPFNHHKNGLPYVAKVEPVTCAAKMHIYCPGETLHPKLARMAIVVPLPESGHSHPPPPKNKCTHAIAERYRECVRKFGPGATVNKVENAQSTKDLLDGKTPSLFHPGLISRDTKTRIIQELKAEWNELSSTATNTRQQVATYLADQESLTDEKRYLQSSLSREGKRIIFGAHPKLLHSIHNLRTLDCDTTFKPVVGDMQIFEINGWLVAINEAVTVLQGRTAPSVELFPRAGFDITPQLFLPTVTTLFVQPFWKV